MDVDLLSKMVKELILDEDVVTLPGLGSFVAEIVPAVFSDKGYTINPPYRRLFFRSRPDEGEGLVDFYASSNKVEKDVAEKIIKDFLSELKDVLHEKKTVVFPGLGRMRATKENNIFFVADENLDIYPDGFGLEPVSLKTHQETPAQVAAAVVDLKSIMTEPFPPVNPEPEVQPEPVVSLTEVVHETETQPEPEPVQPEITSEPALEPAPEPASESAPESEPEPEAEQEQVLMTVPETEPEQKKPKKMPEAVVAGPPQPRAEKPKSAASRIFKAFLWTVAAAAILVITFTVVARMNPGIMDSILYTPEELEIVRTL